MNLEEGEPIEPLSIDRCPNPACHCIGCICGENCHCSFLEHCECATAPGVVPGVPPVNVEENP